MISIVLMINNGVYMYVWTVIVDGETTDHVRCHYHESDTVMLVLII